MGNKLRPPSPPCLAVLYRNSSKLKLVSLNGETSRDVKISDYQLLGIVTINGQVYAVDERNILQVNSDGTRICLKELALLSPFTQVLSFQNQLHIIQADNERMIQFDPVDGTTSADSTGRRFSEGFCCCASDYFIYAMGGRGTETSATRYDPLLNTWTDIESMKHKRIHSSSSSWRNRIYVMGGLGNLPGEFYDPQTSTWNEVAKLNVHRIWFSACVINNQLYAVGGDFLQRKQSVEVYDGNQWNVVTNFILERYIDMGVHACVWPHG